MGVEIGKQRRGLLSEVVGVEWSSKSEPHRLLGPVWHGSRAKLQGGAGQSMPNTLTPEL
jgi:hypothetical protein